MGQEKWSEEDKQLEQVEGKEPEQMERREEEKSSNKVWIPFAGVAVFIIVILVLIQDVSAPKGNQTSTAAPESIEKTDNVHADINFKDMKYVHFDPTQLYENISKVKGLSGESGKEEELFQVYETILGQYDEMNTMSTLNDIYYYGDSSNEYYVTEQKYNYQMAEEVTDAMGSMIKTVLDSQYGIAFREKIGEKTAKKYEDYKEMTEEQKQLLEEERNLVQDYEKKVAENVTVEIDGETWDSKKLSELGDSDEDINKLVDVSEAIENKLNKEIVKIYKKLINTRGKLAKTYGYDNYMDYAYEKIFERDFSKEDTKKLQKYAEEYIASLYLNYLYFWGDGITSNVYEMEAWDSEKIISTVQKYVGDISPELSKAYDYMVQNNLYDINASQRKMEMGFTTKLASYQAPYMFDNPYGNYYDIKTVMHEFGHYNNFYQVTTPSFYGESCLDLAEIHSQGLELLFLSYFKDMFGDNGEDMEHCFVVDLLGGILDGCIYNEFERAVYENPNMSAEEMNKKFYKISEKYGRETGTEEDGTTDWIRTTHIFQTPFYYISYATSGLSAFNIWQESLTDRDGAVEKYMKLSKIGSESSFLQALENNQLEDIFKEDFFVNLYETIDTHYAIEDEEIFDEE